MSQLMADNPRPLPPRSGFCFATEMGTGREVLAAAWLVLPRLVSWPWRAEKHLEYGAFSITWSPLRYAHLFWTKGKVPPVSEPQAL